MHTAFFLYFSEILGLFYNKDNAKLFYNIFFLENIKTYN